MSDKKYTLGVEIPVESQSLKAAVKDLQHLVDLKNELAGKVDMFNDDDIKGLSQLITKTDQVTVAIKEKKKAIEQLTKEQKKELDLQYQIAAQQGEYGKRVAELNLELQRQKKLNADDAKAKAGLVTLYDRLSKQLIENKKRAKDLLVQNRELTASEKEFIKTTEELDKRLKRVDERLGDGGRFVGLYKQEIHKALQETGLFDNGIGRLAISLNELKEKLEANSKSTKSFSSNLKLGVVAGVGAAVAALKELSEINNDVKEFFEDASDVLGGFFTGSIRENQAFTKALRDSKIALRALGLEMQLVTLDEEDFREISNDTTIGFKERNIALNKSIELSKQRTKLAVESARIELDVINKQVAAANSGIKKASPEILDKQAEAQKKLNEALDQQNDVVRESAELLRKRNVEEATAAVELLRSKKLSYGEQQAILEDQLKDERRQLEDRRKINKELLLNQNETTKEEIKLFKEKTGIQFDENKLLNETDQIKLANQLKSIKQTDEEGKLVGIGEEAIQTLAKIVKEYQENRIKNAQNIKVLDEEEIKRNERLAQIQKERTIQQLQDKVGDTQKLADDRTTVYEDTNEKILKEENLFNGKMDKLRKIQFDLMEAAIIQNAEAQKELLQAQADADIQRVNDSIKDEKIKAAEIKKINEKLAIDLANVEDEERKKEREINKQKLEDEKKLNQERVKLAAERTDSIVGKVDEALDKRSQKNIDRINKEQEAQEKALERAQDRAERGLSNDLELQQRKAAELEARKAEQAKKDARREKLTTFYNLLSGYAKENAQTALFKAGRDMAESEIIALAFAEKGGIIGDITDKTLLKNGTLSKTHKSGDRLVVASPNEGMLNETQINNLGGKQAFYDLATMLNNPINDDVLFPKVPYFTPVAYRNDNGEVAKEIRDLKKTIEDKPVSYAHLNNAGDVINTTIERGVKHILKVVSKKPGFVR